MSANMRTRTRTHSAVRATMRRMNMEPVEACEAVARMLGVKPGVVMGRYFWTQRHLSRDRRYAA